jgi:serine protease Do
MNHSDDTPTAGHERGAIEPFSPRQATSPLATRSPPAETSGAMFTVNRSVFLGLGVFLLFAPWAIEYLIARYQRAATRARLMAEYEFAVEKIGEQSTPLREISMGSQMVFRKIRPSVVSIQARNTSDASKPRAQGSGIAISADGYIVTNHHVIKDFERVEVEIEGRRRLVAEVIGGDELTDLAVIKVDATDLVPAEWGDSDLLHVGSMVWAIGSPFGLQNSVTSGIISSTERHGESNPYQEFLQTDAAVNPGNSGGPLVDENGRVVGINTLIYGNRYQGISFAVPSSLARKICDAIIKDGRFVRGFLGVLPARVFTDDMARLNLPDTSGALLQRVDPGTPADGAGLRSDDVIRKWDDKAILNDQLLYREVALTAPGSLVNVSLIRDGEEKSVRVHVGQATRRMLRN